MGMPNVETAKPKERPGSQVVTSTSVLQRRQPLRLCPRNRAPTAGPAAPLRHSPPAFSGLSRPIAGRSLTSDQTLSAGALICVLRVRCMAGAYG